MTSSQNNVDMDSFIDFTDYDGYQSSSHSPATDSKPTFASPLSQAVPTPPVSASQQQTLSGPSHDYSGYPQQTGFVPGAIATTMAVNQTNNTGYQDVNSLNYFDSFTNQDPYFDFNNPSPNVAGSEVDMGIGSSPDSQNLNFAVNPSAIEQTSSSPSQTSQVGRLWPGAHSQAAMAKAQAQRAQQQQVMQQQQQQQQQQQPPQQRSRAKSATDPLVEQKITQLLNTMRAKPSEPDANAAQLAHLARTKKEDEDMDEDERLLASEEGKKLSSKERRQLRNKVSARAFRSRRKEYITQLESEIANKVNENGVLRSENRALQQENKRLQEFTRMLLSSTSFSSFLDTMSTNPNPAMPQPGPQVKMETPEQQQPQQTQAVPKDVGGFGAAADQQQIGMAMIPEQAVDFSMLNLDGQFHYQPQVFVVDTPEMPAPIDASVLSGKSSNFVEPLETTEEKVEAPVIERMVEPTEVSEPVAADAEFEADPEFALFHSEPTAARAVSEGTDTDRLSSVDIFGGIDAEKVLCRYELVDASEEDTAAAVASARVQRLSESIESVVSRLEVLTMGL